MGLQSFSFKTLLVLNIRFASMFSKSYSKLDFLSEYSKLDFIFMDCE